MAQTFRNLMRTPGRRPRAFALAAVVLALALAALGWWAWQHWWIEGPLRQAQTAWAKHHLLEAKQHLSTGLERAPQHPEMLLLAASVARRLGEYDEAADLLARCDQVPAVDHELAKLENILLGVQRNGVRTGQEAQLQSLAESNPPHRPFIYEAMAQGFMTQQSMRLPAAKICLDKSLEELPNNPVALRLRGAVSLQMTRSRDAIGDYRRAFELDPNHELGQIALANSLYLSGRFTEALPLFEKLIERRPENPTLQVGLAGCRASNGQLDEARRLLDALLAKEPRHSVALMERGRLALELNQPAEAEKWLLQALAVDPSDRRTNHLLYQCLSLQGKEIEAKKQLARSQQILADLSRWGEIMTEELNKRPNDPDLLQELGMLMLRNNQERQGLHWLERALEIDPKHRKAHQTLAEYYERINQPERAAWHRGKLP